MQLGDPLNEILERPAQPIQTPANQGIPVPDVGERLGQAFALGLCAADRIREDFQAAGRSKRVLLEMEMLLCH